MAVRLGLCRTRESLYLRQIASRIRVPFREISLAPTKTMNGEIEINEPVRVYDTSGPWGDPSVDVDVTRGLPPLRAKWIRERADVEEIEGRDVRPIDDGYFVSQPSMRRRSETANSEFGIRNAQLRTKAAARAQIASSDAALVRAPGNHHARNGIHRDSRKCRTRSAQTKHQTSNIKHCPQRSRTAAPRRRTSARISRAR